MAELPVSNAWQRHISPLDGGKGFALPFSLTHTVTHTVQVTHRATPQALQ
jgi:hypothetical protein